MNPNDELGGGLDLSSQLSALAQRLGVRADPQGKLDADHFVAAIEKHYADIARLRDLCAERVTFIETKERELAVREARVQAREQKVYGVEKLHTLEGKSSPLFNYFRSN